MRDFALHSLEATSSYWSVRALNDPPKQSPFDVEHIHPLVTCQPSPETRPNRIRVQQSLSLPASGANSPTSWLSKSLPVRSRTQAQRLGVSSPTKAAPPAIYMRCIGAVLLNGHDSARPSSSEQTPGLIPPIPPGPPGPPGPPPLPDSWRSSASSDAKGGVHGRAVGRAAQPDASSSWTNVQPRLDQPGDRPASPVQARP